MTGKVPSGAIAAILVLAHCGEKEGGREREGENESERAREGERKGERTREGGREKVQRREQDKAMKGEEEKERGKKERKTVEREKETSEKKSKREREKCTYFHTYPLLINQITYIMLNYFPLHIYFSAQTVKHFVCLARPNPIE